MTSEYPQDGGWERCCWDYRIDAWLKNCVVYCDLAVIRCICLTNVHTEHLYPQDDDRWKKADGLYYIGAGKQGTYED